MLTKKQIEALKKRWKEKRAIPQVVEDEQPESQNEDRSKTLSDLRSLDEIIDSYIRSFGPSDKMGSLK